MRNTNTIVDTDKKLVVGLGSALVDILVHEGDEFLDALGVEKGGMSLVDNKLIEQVLEKTGAQPHFVPGGSACNTIIGISALGGKGRFVGKCGEGEFGTLIETDLKKNRVEPFLLKSSSATGRVLSMVTADAQRTMLTYLGASAEIGPDDIAAACFDAASIVHLEGYLLFNEDLMRMALKRAKEANASVSLDLASFTVVEQSRDLLEDIIREYVDILIANEDEARAFTGLADEGEAIGALSEQADIAVLKLGERGSMVSVEGSVVQVAPKGTGAAVDTTGAGDLWASGFLYGLVNGLPYQKCGELGSACGYEVCQVMGANIPEEGWARIKTLL